MDRATRLNPNESRALTGLRGCGALLVVAHHCYLHLASTGQPELESLLRRGYLGVDLFFVLSGFVLSLAYGIWFDGSSTTRLGTLLTFLLRRFARLWPLHVTVLLVVLAANCCPPRSDVTLHTLVSNFTLTQAWGFSRSINTPTWSISTECLAYLLFPALAASVLRGRPGLILGLAAVPALLGVALYFAPLEQARRGTLDIYHNYSLLPLARCLAGFILGMLTWRAGGTRPVQRIFSNAWTGPGALFLTLVVMLAGVDDLAIYLLLPIIVLGMHFGTGPLIRHFAAGPIYGLGILSYAIYLIHFELLDHFPFGWAPTWFALACFAAVLLALAAVAHAMIEVPGRVLIRRWANGPQRQAPNQTAISHPCSGPRHRLFRFYSIFRR